MQGHTSTSWGQGLNQDSLSSQVLITTLRADGAGLHDHAHGSRISLLVWGRWMLHLDRLLRAMTHLFCIFICIHLYLHRGSAGKLTESPCGGRFTASRSLRTPSSSRVLSLHPLSVTAGLDLEKSWYSLTELLSLYCTAQGVQSSRFCSRKELWRGMVFFPLWKMYSLN